MSRFSSKCVVIDGTLEETYKVRKSKSPSAIKIINDVPILLDIEGTHDITDGYLDHNKGIKCKYLDAHQLEEHLGDLVFCNTGDDSVRTTQMNLLYQPSFVNPKLATDQCHLNGVHSFGNRLLVTCLSNVEPWRDNFNKGRIWFTDDEDKYGEVYIPHSPVVHDNNVYVLESGLSRLVKFDINLENKTVVVDKLQGFARGMVIVNDEVYIATSQLRKKSSFYNFIEDNASFHGNKCAIWKYNLKTKDLQMIKELNEITDISDIGVL